MTIAIGMVMVLAAAAYVAVPFFVGPPVQGITGPRLATAPERQKLEAYAAIKEVEFDYQMGKLSETDFTKMRDKYAAQALEAIAALEETKVAQPRPRTETRRPTRIAFCPTCGHAVPPRANFCPACGGSLKEEAVA